MTNSCMNLYPRHAADTDLYRRLNWRLFIQLSSYSGANTYLNPRHAADTDFDASVFGDELNGLASHQGWWDHVFLGL